MIEVFITDISNKIQAEKVLNNLQKKHPDLRINYDLSETELPFPCGHTILRIEGIDVNTKAIMKIVIGLGFQTEILEDKICN
jgi:hypothetical protein